MITDMPPFFSNDKQNTGAWPPTSNTETPQSNMFISSETQNNLSMNPQQQQRSMQYHLVEVKAKLLGSLLLEKLTLKNKTAARVAPIKHSILEVLKVDSSSVICMSRAIGEGKETRVVDVDLRGPQDQKIGEGCLFGVIILYSALD